MRKEALRAIADDVGAESAEELAQTLGEESLFGDSSLSYCLACGASGPSLEPDAANVKCEECGARSVAGLDNVVMQITMMNPDKLNEWLT